MIDPATIATSIQSQISSTVDQTIKDYVANIIRELSLDSTWINKIERQINESIAQKFGQKLSLIDLDSLVAQQMDAALERLFERQRARPSGVKDLARTTQLTVSDDGIKTEGPLETNGLVVMHDATVEQTLTVKNLAVKGTINTDSRTWQELKDGLAALTLASVDQQWRQALVRQVREEITQGGIDFANVTVDGHALLQDNTLASNIRHSSLQTVGTLENLSVRGSSDLGDSLSVRPRRVGINTQHPDMALTIWDEEVSLIFGKYRDKTAFIGTLRPQRLAIGINRTPSIDIDETGKISVPNLTVGRHRICHEPECPNYSGTKGDIVFNSNPKNDSVWGWQCLGAFRWIPLKSG